MKSTPTATLFLASLLILLFTSTADDDVVYDVDGNELQKGVPYYIKPPIWGPLGGPVTLFSPDTNNKTCHADVVQHPSEVGQGTPFTFTPTAHTQHVIKLFYSLAINSSYSPCGGSTIWKVESREGLLVDIVTTGGLFNTPSSCIQIVKPAQSLFRNTYMFQQCPNMCGAAAKICYPLGLYGRNGVRYLSRRGTWPFEFVFSRALTPVIATV